MTTAGGPVRRDPGSRRWRVTSLMLGQSTQNLTLGTLALLLPLIRDDIAMTFSQAGALSVATTLAYALGQVPAGVLGDRLGARRVMLVGLVGLNVLTAVIAVAQTYAALAVLLVAVGAMRALVFAPGLSLVTAEYDVTRRATAMSLFMAAGFASTLIVSVAAPPLVGLLGWQGVFAVFGGVGLATVALYSAASRSAAAPAVEQRRRSGADLAVMLHERIVWLASLVQFTRLAVTISLRFWLPSYLVVDKGFSLGAAALVVAVGSAVSIVATMVGGHLSDRSQRPLLVIAVSLVALAVGLVLVTLAQTLALILAVVAGLYVFVQAYSGALFEVPLRVLGAADATVLNGFGNFWANVGGLVMSYALGSVKDATGTFTLGWWGLALLCILALGGTYGMRTVLARAAAPVD